MQRLIRHMRAQDYGHRIIDLQIMGGGSASNEWFYTMNSRLPDYSEAGNRRGASGCAADRETVRSSVQRCRHHAKTAREPK